MSDQWPMTVKKAQLYQAAFPTFGGSMGVRPLRSGEEYWYDRIKPRFMYPVLGAFTDPPTATENAHIPNPRTLRALTSAGKEIVYLSGEESVGSSNEELSSWSDIFAGVLRDLGIDPEEKKKKPKKNKVITIDADVTSKKGGSSRTAPGVVDKGTLRFRQSNFEDYVIISDSLEGLSSVGEKKAGAAGSRSSGSAGSRNPDARATPSSLAHDEEEEEEETEEHAVKLVRKRSRETTAGASLVPKPGGVPLIGKQSDLRSLYRAKNKTPDKKGVVITEPLEPAQKRLRVTIKPLTAVGVEAEKEKKIDEEKKAAEEKRKAAEEREKTVAKPVGKAIEKETTSEKPIVDAPKEARTAADIAHDKAQGPEVVRGLTSPCLLTCSPP
ncbi:hypothetical protein Hanom_Chr02g00152711 [Helianthus anomalus]